MRAFLIPFSTNRFAADFFPNKPSGATVVSSVLQAPAYEFHTPRMTLPAQAHPDASTFRRLADEHAPELTRYASGILSGDIDAARDVVQDAFVRLWQKPPAESSNLRAWLFAVCRTKSIDLLRRRGRWVSDEVVKNSAADETPAPDRKLENDDSGTALFALVDALPARTAEIVKLKFRDDLSYAEIAEVTGLTATNVGFILHGAIKTLREQALRKGDFKR